MKQGDLVWIDVAQIRVNESRRSLDEEKIDELVKSIGSIGLLNPVTIIMIEGYPHLAGGHHRLEAFIRRGEQKIPCVVLDTTDPLKIELVEIDENLVRKELGPADHALLTERRAELMRKLAERERVPPSEDALPSSERLPEGEKDAREPGSVRDQAKKTGEHKDKIQRSRSRARKIGARILRKLRGTSLDKGVELDALAKLPEVERVELAERAAAGESVSARVAKASGSEAASVQTTTREEALGDLRSWRIRYSDVEELFRLSEPMSIIETALASEPPSLS